MAGMSTADIESGVEAGPPLRVPYKTPYYYGGKQFPPGDIYSNHDVMIAAMRADLDPRPHAFLSRALYERIEALAPGTLDGMSMVLVGPEGEECDYLAVTPKAKLEAREAKDAEPGDLQWATTAFAPGDAPAAVFALQHRNQQFLIVSRAVGLALDIDSFRDAQLSAFHRTQASGGARPAIAALTRMLANESQPGDAETVRKALQDGAAVTPSTSKTRATSTSKSKTRAKATSKAKAKAKTKTKTKAKPTKKSKTKSKAKTKTKTKAKPTKKSSRRKRTA